MAARFGPGGNSEEFARCGYKSTVDAPKFLFEKGLDAYEVECGRGVNMREETALKLAKTAKQYDIALSIHAPYYISLASIEEQKRLNSVKYILSSAKLARLIGANRIVVHPGGLNKMTREESTAMAKETLRLAIDTLDQEGLSDIIICPETMGKINQLGDLDEIMEFCLLDDRMIPCIDFGHLNARTLGGLATADHYGAILDTIENKLGHERMANIHAHFSKIEYSKGGEVRHLTFSDTQFGPDYEPLLDLVARRMDSPVFICESAGTQSEDAFEMKQYYTKCLKEVEK